MSSALAWRSTALLPWSCRADAIASAAAALVAAADKGAVPDDGADDDADDDADAVPDDAGAVLGAAVFLFLAAAAARSIPNGFIEETTRARVQTRVHACQTESWSRTISPHRAEPLAEMSAQSCLLGNH